MKASVIIATYGREECLVDSIRSVLRQDYPDFELIIVDQTARHQPEVENFLRNLDDPRYSYFLVNPPSLPAARNFGLSKASGEIVIFIDDDIALEPGFIQGHIDTYGQSEKIGAVSGRVHVPGLELDGYHFRFSEDGGSSGDFDRPDEADVHTARGCNMSFRVSLLKAIGQFNPSYEGNALREETDVCFRLRRLDYRIRYTPAAALTHFEAPSGGCRETDMWSSMRYYQNETLFYRRCFTFPVLWLFLVNSFKSNLWAWKWTALGRKRFKAYITGVSRGVWLSFFPKTLNPVATWQLDRIRRPAIPEKV